MTVPHPRRKGGHDPVHRDPVRSATADSLQGIPHIPPRAFTQSLSGISRRLIHPTARAASSYTPRGMRHEATEKRQPDVPPVSSSPHRHPRSRPVRVTPRPNRGADVSPRSTERDVPVWANLEGLVSPKCKATPTHVPLPPHPESWGLAHVLPVSKNLGRTATPWPRKATTA
ncbi:hypothetical protein BDP81DRAFT_393689 [Colletotrichum phormii]|uniref:Uncharacterized protein n=1 Tax=Colletotrichum phormii TaxID=359342 RepID=A0AAI9ZSE8_9PEZI|nr:uncharacterized protein BDP81DRAFT_393689 [Colletotrichum phormii]KAK1636975.1 hypothetical protein BDP81DRAFT_393689 [Colletotrichum phormii]